MKQSADSPLDRDRLALFLKRRMEENDMSARAASQEIGCSPATLGRLLQGSRSENTPDTVNVIRAVSWMGMSLSDFERVGQQRDSTIADVEVHLRALKGISDETADAIVAMVKAAYDSATTSKSRR